MLRSATPFAGSPVVVTAGPTREALDPVRVITNRSSGRMGYALAEAAFARGAEVLLISGPTTLAAPPGIEIQRVESTEQLEPARALPGLPEDPSLLAPTPSAFRPATPTRE